MEAVVAVQALNKAYYHYFGAVADYNRAQFRLYRALGNPAQALAVDEQPASLPTAPGGQGRPERSSPAPAVRSSIRYHGLVTVVFALISSVSPWPACRARWAPGSTG